MESKRQATVCFTVERQSSGQWEVSEAGLFKSIAFFTDKRDALHFAQALAQTKVLAEVRVRD
jgi:hypothetical protein